MPACMIAALLVWGAPGLLAGARASHASAAKSSAAEKKKSPVNSSSAARPRNFVPTFADSTKDDIAEFDDPVVRDRKSVV